MSAAKPVPPFVMRLRGEATAMLKLSTDLAEKFPGTEVKYTAKHQRAKLVAKVPQEHARAAMAFTGLP
jgi:hypothetical protein